jgi:hypothetical protein
MQVFMSSPLTHNTSLQEDGKPASGLPKVRWRTVLVWLMRLTAVLWLAKGLVSWLTILGIGGGIEDKPLSFQATTVYFAILDLMAAVALWFASVWGGILWLLAVMSHLILATFFPKLVPFNLYNIISHGALMMAYIAISWLASREET